MAVAWRHRDADCEAGLVFCPVMERGELLARVAGGLGNQRC